MASKELQIEPHNPMSTNLTGPTATSRDLTWCSTLSAISTCPQGRLLVQFRRTYTTPGLGIKDGTAISAEQVRLERCTFKANCTNKA
jgi:hypothetical protein